MRPFNLSCLLFAGALLLGASAVQAKDDDTDVQLPAGTLSAADVVKLFSNKTVETRTVVKKRDSLTYYHPAGEVIQQRDGTSRRGFWRVRKDGRICLQMEELEEKCRIIVRGLGGGYRKYIVRKNGLHQPTVDYLGFVDGNQLDK